jgi:hypothetical protein
MKRYFVAWIFAVAVLTLSGVANGQQNLQLILEGPFVICENLGSTPNTLTIALPYLQGTHYAPGFTSNLSDLQLGIGYNHLQYPDVMDNLTLNMDLHGWKGTQTMALNPSNRKDPTAYFYSEKGDCRSLNKSSQSLLFTVPVPDELWALNPTADKVYITDHSNSARYKGECAKEEDKGCKQATRLELRYNKLLPANIVEIDTVTCSAKPCTDDTKWQPFKTSLPIGSELELLLSAEPVADPDEHGHAIAAFHAASRSSGNYNDLHFANGGKDPAAHKTCHIPPVVLCSTYTTYGACPKN